MIAILTVCAISWIRIIVDITINIIYSIINISTIITSLNDRTTQYTLPINQISIFQASQTLLLITSITIRIMPITKLTYPKMIQKIHLLTLLASISINTWYTSRLYILALITSTISRIIILKTSYAMKLV